MRVDEEAEGAGSARLRFARRVSWTPGAEGAPRKDVSVEVGWALGGTMRMACLVS